MEKIRYEVDPQNRLVEKSTGLHGFRRVLDGNFKIAKNNTLTYHIKAPAPYDTKAPHQVKLKGEWSLTKGHQLCLTLDKWKRQTFGDQLRLEGEIIDVRKNSLVFALTSRTKENTASLYILELAGAWQADTRNRITFRVDNGEGRYNTLIFEGAWQLDKKYQIIYRYEKEDLLRRTKRIHTLVFKGYWDIKDKFRLAYVIDKNIGSGFDFKTSLGVFKDNYIRYELGLGLAGKKEPVKRSITFFGKWKIKKEAGLVFEVEQGNRKIQALAFGAELKLSDRNTVLCSLKNSSNKGIGAQLELSRDIFKKDGQAFLRLLKSNQEAVILVGAGFKW